MRKSVRDTVQDFLSARTKAVDRDGIFGRWELSGPGMFTASNQMP